MSTRRQLPVREVLGGRRLSWVDLVVGAGIIAVLYAVVRLGQSMAVNFTRGRTPVIISTNITNVPYDAARSLLRMYLALTLSIVFTLVYGTAAARLPRAEKVLVPILDILQSIPILVFLPIALTFFIKIFPHSLLGLEAASIFVIFTSQAWNMTFSFYHSLISQPTELRPRPGHHRHGRRSQGGRRRTSGRESDRCLEDHRLQMPPHHSRPGSPRPCRAHWRRRRP